MSNKNIKWEKLDNAAILFPAIAGTNMTNVYRISVVLNEKVEEEKLQLALNSVLPKFPGFKVTLKLGFFWYYFEENNNPAPLVTKEEDYPCKYIDQKKNNEYLFKVSYYENRINLEIFHVLADGVGGINFLLELTYHYLDLAHSSKDSDDIYYSYNTSINREDSFLKYYDPEKIKKYPSERAFIVRGEKMLPGELGIIHGNISVTQLKKVCDSYKVSINEYLVSNFIYSIFHENMQNKKPISVAVPVNLRPYFPSTTTKNFFIMVSAEFKPTRMDYTFEEVLDEVSKDLRSKITKEKLTETLSYNVSNEKNLITRAIPLIIKNIAVRSVYKRAALANTSTITNIGNIKVEPQFEKYISSFYAILSMSLGQSIKGTICSYKDTLVFTFSSTLVTTKIQRAFFRQLSWDNLDVFVESNGVYDEKM
ncbi:MAG TPA: hypothetical protein VJ916_02985 [Anaerovoracaceae bacterium]|nr:hypothetical protein [Anaerovoracaceae bacterium]